MHYTNDAKLVEEEPSKYIYMKQIIIKKLLIHERQQIEKTGIQKDKKKKIIIQMKMIFITTIKNIQNNNNNIHKNNINEENNINED